MLAAILVCAAILATPADAGGVSGDDLAVYEKARASIGRDADAHVRLALWCEAHGLTAQRVKHLALAVLIDPSQATARGLLGLVAYRGHWRNPTAVTEKVQADEALAASLAEYNARRARTPDQAEAQWRLALWCAEKGLDAEAHAHLAAVVRLDPSREAAWKRLGCKKVGNRWVTEAQLNAEKDEAEAQKRADRHWRPLLEKWRGWLGKTAKRTEAEALLAGVNDPRAVPAVWSVFALGNAASQEFAVQLLGQIDAAGASRSLALLAVFSGSAEVRRKATETLRGRDPREYAGLLIALLQKPVRFEVRPVGGPGSPGALFIEGRQVNVQRIYAPPPLPSIPSAPSDRLVFDINGLPVIDRTSMTQGSSANVEIGSEVLSLSQFAGFNPTDPAMAGAVADFRANEPALWSGFFASHPNNHALLRFNPAAERQKLGVQISQIGTRTTTVTQQTQIPIGQIMAEYQQAALERPGPARPGHRPDRRLQRPDPGAERPRFPGPPRRLGPGPGRRPRKLEGLVGQPPGLRLYPGAERPGRPWSRTSPWLIPPSRSP